MPNAYLSLQLRPYQRVRIDAEAEIFNFFTFNPMSLTQFAMVEELALLIKENIPCKHLILSIEEALVNFLRDDTSLNGILELEPMNSYNRLLVHRLAEIFGFLHQSIGEGEDRHLILERCPETSIPSILVSDLLWQFDEVQSPTILYVLRQNKVIPDQGTNAARESSLEERETAYFAARDRIFSADICDTKLVKQRPLHDPVVARRMITHALGQTNKATNRELILSSKKCELAEKNVKIQQVDEGTFSSSNETQTKLLSAKHSMGCTMPKVQKFSESDSSDSKILLAKGGFVAERHKDNIQENCLRNEHMGAAKRLFASALGIRQRNSNLSNCNETKRTDC